MADARKRKTPEGASKSGSERPVHRTVPQPSIGLPVNAILAVASLFAAGWLWYSGAFSSSPSTTAAADLASSSTPAPGQALTDAQLREYDGSDPDKPLYLAINGTIFDVSSGRGFYGPGGHYGHFAGRDANRAWVTECWDSEDQLTHDMRGVEEMFMPKYMDAEFADAADGKGEAGEALRAQAKQVIERFGRVTKKERRRRKEEETPEALEKVDAALAHWVKFFSGSGKYAQVGKVVRDEGWEKTAPEPPALCEAAKKRRPIRGGGKLDSIMNANMKMGGDQGEEIAAGQRIPDVPKLVKQKLNAE
ncbi:hypothetical protein LTR08_000856 [Meristemomyces frigidus]|nr:hypothetical protein LTR08_000856 [Meristemomyces frigidus]